MFHIRQKRTASTGLFLSRTIPFFVARGFRTFINRVLKESPCSSDQQRSLKFRKLFQTTALAKSI
jgi:hypothetical protein